MGIEQVFELSEKTGHLQDGFLRRQICDIVQYVNIDKDYAEFLMNMLIHGYIKNNHKELFEVLTNK